MAHNTKGLERFVQKHEEKIIRFEIILLFMAALGYIFKYFGVHFGNLLLLVSLGTLSLLYYFLAFKKIKSAEGKTFMRFCNKLTYWSYSIASLGILFFINNYEGHLVMLQVGLPSVILTFVFTAYILYKYSENEDFNKMNLLKNLVFIIVFAAFYISSLQKTKHEDESKLSPNPELEVYE